MFPETYRPGSAVVRSRHLGRPKPEEERFTQYERRLESLDKKKRKKKKKVRKKKRENFDVKIEDEGLFEFFQLYFQLY